MVGTRNRYRFSPIQWGDDNNMSFSTMKIGAFADRKKFEDIESQMIIPILSFSKLSVNKPSPDLHSSTKTLENNDDLNDSKSALDEDGTIGDELVEENQQKDENKNGEDGNGSVDSKSALTMLSTNDDFIMVELKTPFATTNPRSELGKFYQEWQAAPPLQTFVDLPPLEETDVIKQLETFELEVNEFDKVVQSLCQSPNNN